MCYKSSIVFVDMSKFFYIGFGTCSIIFFQLVILAFRMRDVAKLCVKKT